MPPFMCFLGGLAVASALLISQPGDPGGADEMVKNLGSPSYAQRVAADAWLRRPRG